MQELIGFYIPMEEYYMRESVNKVDFSLYCIYTYIFLKNGHDVLILFDFSLSNKFRKTFFS